MIPSLMLGLRAVYGHENYPVSPLNSENSAADNLVVTIKQAVEAEKSER